LLAVSIMFGANYVAVKKILEVVPRHGWMFWRIVLATLILVPVALRRGRLPRRASIWGALLLASALGVIGNQIMFAEGMALTLPARASVINSMIPLLTLVFAVAARQERLDSRRAVALATALTGTLVLLRADQIVAGGVPDHDMLIGDLLVFGNAATFSAFLVLMRFVVGSVEPMVATAICFVYGCFAIGAYSGAHGAITTESLVLLAQPNVIGWALFAIFGATVVTYLLNAWALSHTHGSQVAFYICTQPIVASILSPHFVEERLGPRFWIAMALVSIAIVVPNIAKITA